MKKINENIKLIIGIIVAIVISSVIATKAATTLSSTSVYYDTSKSGGSSSNVNGAIDELYSLTTDRDKLKTEILNLTWPVGSIYTSIEDNTVEKVQERFGGKWETFSEGTTLVGNDGTNYITNDNAKGSGGSSTVTLSESNLPSHSHVIPALSVSSWSGSHNHASSIGGFFFIMNGSSSETIGGFSEGMAFQGATKARVTTTGDTTVKVSGQKTTASNTTTCTNCSATSFSVQDPYTVVYMYKRTS